MGLKRNAKGELIEVSPLRTRKGSVYLKGTNKIFKVSRSKFSNFLDCKRCFYLERVKGLKDPGMPGWSLNSAVDELLKKEFDYYRKIQKPHKASVATERWKSMRGRSGTLYSGLWVVDNSDGSHHGGLGRVSHATVHFAENISDAEIKAYVKTGEPLNVAGAFTLDARGAALISHLEGDPWAVVGMSASALRLLIRGLGHDYHSLWSS